MNDTQIDLFTERSPGKRLAMLHRLSQAYMSGPLANLGISRGKVGFLLSVLKTEGISQEELSRELYIDRAATARAVQALEESGLVRREEDPEDRRRKRVYPTDKARALQPEFLDILHSHNEALYAGLSGVERDRFLSMLDRLVENLRAEVEGVER